MGQAVRKQGWGCFKHSKLPGFMSMDVYLDDFGRVNGDLRTPCFFPLVLTLYYYLEISRVGRTQIDGLHTPWMAGDWDVE